MIQLLDLNFVLFSSQLVNVRISVVKDRITTVTTPGETVDVLVTERGIAINPLRKDLIEKFKNSNLPIKTIEELKEIAESMTGKNGSNLKRDELLLFNIEMVLS